MGGSLTPEELYSLSERFKVFQQLLAFIETGTYHGDSTRVAALFFKDVYTYEIVPELFENSKCLSEKLNMKNCHHYLGDSVKLLGETLDIEKRPAMFFLDAHISGKGTGHNGIYGSPVLDELKVINAKYPKGQPALICVDDVRLWKA
jgi:hypothetical protein